jgi:hypothetical protein
VRAVGPSALRVPVLTGCVVAISLLVAGCGGSQGTNNTAVTVSGSTLSIYASQPPENSGGQAAGDVVDAERLAFDASDAKVGPYRLALHVIDDDEVSADVRPSLTRPRSPTSARSCPAPPGSRSRSPTSWDCCR